MYKHNFDLCIANCKECNGINVVPIGEDDMFICKETEKILCQDDETTLIELGLERE